MKHKRILSVLLAAVLLLMLAGCGGRSGGSDGKPESSDAGSETKDTAEDTQDGSNEETEADEWKHISTPEEFLAIADDLDGHYILDNDINDWDSGESTLFTPIGTPDDPFTGVLNGNGYSVTCTLVYSGQDPAWGIFGCNEERYTI
ncbi:MAG: hypothetical protein IJM62_06765 [Lachnospiraceae bacterium]|nr:hypothetical protein [Lachnospiraceae bacterium]